jgi:uncharacterized membrane protein
MSKFKNYKLWVAIAAFIPMLLKGFGVDILPSNYDELINALLGILVLIGIINSPDSSDKTE